jgi:putative hydrolase of HD superfamily
MSLESSSDAVVQRQLDAYNAHDLDAWIATYAPDAQQFEHPATLLASGVDAIRARAAPRFAEPDLHARLLKRTVADHVVVDHEVVTRNFDAGVGTVEMVCIYVVKGDRIQSASFVFGPTVMRSA